MSAGPTSLLICDAPVSALEVSIQAQVINLPTKLRRDPGLAMIFIAHDLSVVKHISDRVMVLYPGRRMELATGKGRFSAPQKPSTQALLGGADPRSGGQARQGDDPAGRQSALADGTTLGLRVSHPLRPRHSALRRRGASPAGWRSRRGLPFAGAVRVLATARAPCGCVTILQPHQRVLSEGRIRGIQAG